MRALCLGFIYVALIACNTSNFGEVDSTDQTVGSSDPESNIRKRVGVRSALSLNAVMQNSAGNRGASNFCEREDISESSCTTDVNHAGEEIRTCTESVVGSRLVNRGSEGNVGNEYCHVAELLPQGGGAGVNSGGVLSLTGAGQVGVFRLGSAYCDNLMRSEELRTQHLPTVAAQLNASEFNFEQRPADLSEALRRDVARALIANFHGTGLAARPDQAQSEQVLTTLMAALASTTEENNSTASNREVLVGACSAALSSAQVTFY